MTTVRSILAIVFAAASPALAQRIINTVAGTSWTFPADGQPAINAPLGRTLRGVGADAAGNIYISDAANARIFRVTPDGILSVIAGNGFTTRGPDGAPAVRFAMVPDAMAVAADGTVFFFDAAQTRIRRLSPDGRVTSIAGTGVSGYSGDNGPALNATIRSVVNVAADAAGNVYFSQNSDHVIRKITPEGVITTIAGTGTAGPAQDGGPANQARLNLPDGLAVDAQGAVYVVDRGNLRIRKIATDGTISTVTGNGRSAFVADGQPAATSPFIDSFAVAVDPAGSVHYFDNGAALVRKIDANGNLVTVAGNRTLGYSGDGGPATRASIDLTTGLAFDAAGTLYMADRASQRIRRVTPDGTISLFAGNGGFQAWADGSPALDAFFNRPGRAAFDARGNFYFCDTQNHRVVRLTLAGTVERVAGSGTVGTGLDGVRASQTRMRFPDGVAVAPDGTIYVSDSGAHRIRRIGADGIIQPFAGTGVRGFSGDGGPARTAQLDGPSDLSFDTAGNLYFVDGVNRRIRRIGADGNINTIAGPATLGGMNPVGVHAAADGSVYIADFPRRILRVSSAGTPSLFAGQATFRPGLGDGGPATNAWLNGPVAITTDRDGNLLIADQGTFRIRQVNRAGVISTIAGTIEGFAGDRGPALSAALRFPRGIAVDGTGRIFVVDSDNHRVRVIADAVASGYRVSSARLAFTAASGTASLPQSFNVESPTTGLPFSATVNTATGGAWLTVQSSAGVMPGSVTIGADARSLAPGTYTGNVVMTVVGGNPQSTTIPVTFTVLPPLAPKLFAEPETIGFSFLRNAPAFARTLTIRNAGGGTFQAASTVSPGAAWLRVTPATGNVTTTAPLAVTVAADPTGLEPGTYTSTITVTGTAGAGEVSIPVTMQVTARDQILRLSTSGLTFLGVQEGGTVLPQSIDVINAGTGSLGWEASLTFMDDGPRWLTLGSTAGTSEAGVRQGPITVQADTSGLASGAYYALLEVRQTGFDEPPQLATIVLQVLPADANPGPNVSPDSLLFIGSVNAPDPPSQTILFANRARVGATFNSVTVTVDGAPWLEHAPARGQVPFAAPQGITVQPRLEGLAAGIYRGALTLAFSDGTNRVVGVTLIVAAVAPPAESNVASNKIRSADCAATALVPVLTSLGNQFATTTGWPVPLSVRVADDCGLSLSRGTVTAFFSNGDPPVPMQLVPGGTWSGTWQPRAAASSELVVTVTAEDASRTLTGSARVVGRVGSNTDVPSVLPGAVMNAASLARHSPVASGTLASVRGTALAESAADAPGFPLPIDLGGSQAILAGRRLPMAAAAGGELRAVIPFEVLPDAGYQLVVRRGNRLSVPEPVSIVRVQPGIFTKDGSGRGQGLVFRQSGDSRTLAETGSAAIAGETIVVRCAGLGPVSAAVAAGEAAPGAPAADVTAPIVLRIGAVEVPVRSAILAPGTAGIYEVTAELPASVEKGPVVPVTITVEGRVSNAVTIAIE